MDLDNVKVSINKKLAVLMNDSDMNIEQLSRIMGVSISTMSGWKNGSLIPSLKQLVKLKRLFNLSTVDELIEEKQ